MTIKTKTRKETSKRERYIEMRILIISMSLFAVVVAYVVLRSPASRTETAKSAVANKNQLEESRQ